MVTYVRTHEGQVAAYSQDSAIPRKLRSLLKVIDGKTTLDVYINSLRAFGDVQGILKSLNMAGLIQPQAQASAAPALPGTNDASGDWVNTRARGPATNPTSAFAASTRFEASTQASFTATRRDSAALGQARAQVLATAVERMSDFVLINAPEHAFVVLKEVESLTTLEQLAVMLGGYEQLISHLGTPAFEHLAYLNKLLREHL